jgi:hypothetical protein
MSFTKTKYDACYRQQQQFSNKSILDYITDPKSKHHDKQCFNVQPPFLAYLPSGVPKANIDVENDLKGMTRNLNKCTECQHKPMTSERAPNLSPHNITLCGASHQIRPKGYLPK